MVKRRTKRRTNRKSRRSIKRFIKRDLEKSLRKTIEASIKKSLGKITKRTKKRKKRKTKRKKLQRGGDSNSLNQSIQQVFGGEQINNAGDLKDKVDRLKRVYDTKRGDELVVQRAQDIYDALNIHYFNKFSPISGEKWSTDLGLVKGTVRIKEHIAAYLKGETPRGITYNDFPGNSDDLKTSVETYAKEQPPPVLVQQPEEQLAITTSGQPQPQPQPFPVPAAALAGQQAGLIRSGVVEPGPGPLTLDPIRVPGATLEPVGGPEPGPAAQGDPEMDLPSAEKMMDVLTGDEQAKKIADSDAAAAAAALAGQQPDQQPPPAAAAGGVELPAGDAAAVAAGQQPDGQPPGGHLPPDLVAGILSGRKKCNLANDASELMAKLKRCEEGAAEIGVEKAALQVEIRDTTVELRQTQAALRERDEELRMALAELERLRRENSQLVNVNSEMQRHYQSQIAELEARIQTLETEIARLRVINQQQEHDIATLNERIRTVTDDGMARRREIAKLGEEIRILKIDKLCSVLGEVMVAAALVEENDNLQQELTPEHRNRFKLPQVGGPPAALRLAERPITWGDLISSLIDRGAKINYDFGTVNDLYEAAFAAPYNHPSEGTKGSIIECLIPGFDGLI